MLCLTMTSIGQSKKDSVTISKKARNNMYARALQADGLDSLLTLCYNRINNLRDDFNNLASKDSAIIENYKKQIGLAEDEKKIYEDQIKTLDKMYRAERRKRRLITFTGILTTGAAIYLSTLK